MSDTWWSLPERIEKKSLGWGVSRRRYQDITYSVKLMVLKPGPMPPVAVVRSAVIDGKEGPRTQVVLPFHRSAKTRFTGSAWKSAGSFFTLFVQDHVVGILV